MMDASSAFRMNPRASLSKIRYLPYQEVKLHRSSSSRAQTLLKRGLPARLVPLCKFGMQYLRLEDLVDYVFYVRPAVLEDLLLLTRLVRR